MDIKRVLSLSDEEFDVLRNAGKLLGSLRDSKDTYDSFDEDVVAILDALKGVIEVLI